MLHDVEILDQSARFSMGPAMTAYWCVNFDNDESVFLHGLKESCWLMQYQYSHGGNVYQGGKRQKSSTTKNWKNLRGIKPGDWLAAYRSGKRFYSVGRVIAPRDRKRSRGRPRHADTVERTVREGVHRFREGIVKYSDAGAFYEDFTDKYIRPYRKKESNELERWRYPQRVDVSSWELVNPKGVRVEGLAKHVPPSKIRLAAFQIPKEFFDEIRARLSEGVDDTVRSPTPRPRTAGRRTASFLAAEDAIDDGIDGEAEYDPQQCDRRALVYRQIRERRGQQQFREAVRRRYGNKCMITGCQALAVLEAAHINPYRGREDNNPANGLLLRSDVHTLFDLDLLGIEADSLCVKLNPEVEKEYGEIGDAVLRCASGKRPSRKALTLRYEQFLQRLQSVE